MNSSTRDAGGCITVHPKWARFMQQGQGRRATAKGCVLGVIWGSGVHFRGLNTFKTASFGPVVPKWTGGEHHK